MNDWNFLSNLNLYLFDGADTVLEVQTIKIDNEKIHISGNLTLNKAN
jgi:hypothetical protein